MLQVAGAREFLRAARVHPNLRKDAADGPRLRAVVGMRAGPSPFSALGE